MNEKPEWLPSITEEEFETAREISKQRKRRKKQARRMQRAAIEASTKGVQAALRAFAECLDTINIDGSLVAGKKSRKRLEG